MCLSDDSPGKLEFKGLQPGQLTAITPIRVAVIGSCVAPHDPGVIGEITEVSYPVQRPGENLMDEAVFRFCSAPGCPSHAHFGVPDAEILRLNAEAPR